MPIRPSPPPNKFYTLNGALQNFEKGPRLNSKGATQNGPDGKGPAPEIERVAAKVGDYIQWTSNGVDQFTPPRKVAWVAEDQSHLRVHGSQTGIPMTEATVVEPPNSKTPAGVTASSAYRAETHDINADISVLQIGKRLEITANVDAAGLVKLKELLDHYEKILKLLQLKRPPIEAASGAAH
jgi:hypothetical protein